jgi:co-chaperonin GroES (HSP10)
MPSVIRMQHDKDPREEILERTKTYIENIHLTGAQVLLGIYRRPTKTAGGIELPDSYRDEDIYQGKAGLILKIGPVPIDKDDDDFFGGRFPKVGDWVVYRPSDGFPMDFGDKQKCRILQDRRQIKMIVNEPDLIF